MRLQGNVILVPSFYTLQELRALEFNVLYLCIILQVIRKEGPLALYKGLEKKNHFLEDNIVKTILIKIYTLLFFH